MNAPIDFARNLKLIQIGEATAVVLPPEMLAKLGVAAGGNLSVSEDDRGYRLNLPSSDHDIKMRAFERIMIEDEEILRALAR